MVNKFFKKKYSNPCVNHQGKEFEINNWITSDFVVNTLVPIVSFHPFPLNELMLMTSTVCFFKPEYIFEWGTNIGKSARIFHEISIAFDIKSQIHSIDLPDDVFHNEHPKNDRGKMVKGIKSVKLHQADGLTCSLNIINQNKPKGNILFFVDGDHSYETVKKELETIMHHVPDAVILLHDTFYQSSQSAYNIGPYEAINEVLKNNSKNYNRVCTNMGLPGMTLIYKLEK